MHGICTARNWDRGICCIHPGQRHLLHAQMAAGAWGQPIQSSDVHQKETALQPRVGVSSESRTNPVGENSLRGAEGGRVYICFCPSMGDKREREFWEMSTAHGAAFVCARAQRRALCLQRGFVECFCSAAIQEERKVPTPVSFANCSCSARPIQSGTRTVRQGDRRVAIYFRCVDH